LFEGSKPLTRADVQSLLDEYLVDVKTAIEDFRIHYLDGQIEVEVILPFALAEDSIKRTYLTTQCKLIRTRIKKIDNVFLFFKL